MSSQKAKQTPAIRKIVNSWIPFIRNRKHARLNNMPFRNTCICKRTSRKTGRHSMKVVVTLADGEGTRWREHTVCVLLACSSKVQVVSVYSVGGRKWNRDIHYENDGV